MTTFRGRGDVQEGPLHLVLVPDVGLGACVSVCACARMGALSRRPHSHTPCAP